MTEEKLTIDKKPLTISRSQMHLGTAPNIYHTQSTPYIGKGNFINLSEKNEMDLDLNLLS